MHHDKCFGQCIMTKALVSASCQKPWSVHPDKSLGQCILTKALVSASWQKPWSVHPVKSRGQCILTKHQSVPYMKDYVQWVLVDFVHVCLPISSNSHRQKSCLINLSLPMCCAWRHEDMSWMMAAHYILFSPTVTDGHVISVIKNKRWGTWFMVSNIRCFHSGLGIYIVGV